MDEKCDFLKIIQAWKPGDTLHLNPVITIGLDAFREPLNAFIKSDDVITVVALQHAIAELTAERDALKAEVAAGKQWRERCEELEVVAAALYLGHDDGRMQFDIYRSSYIATADDDIMWERAALEGESR